MFRLLFFTSLLLFVSAEEWHETFAKNLRSKKYTKFEQLENWKAAMEDNNMTVACSDEGDKGGDQTKRDSYILRESWAGRRCTIRFPKMKPSKDVDGDLEATKMNLQEIFRLLWGFAKLPVWKDHAFGHRVGVEIELDHEETFLFRLQKNQCGQIMVYNPAGDAPPYSSLTKAFDKEVHSAAVKVSIFLLICFQAQFHSKRMQPLVAMLFFLQEADEDESLIPKLEKFYFESLNQWISTVIDKKPAGEIVWGTNALDPKMINVTLEYLTLIGVSHHHVHRNKNFVQQFPTCEVLESQLCH